MDRDIYIKGSVSDNISGVSLEHVINGVLRPSNHACICKIGLTNMKTNKCPIGTAGIIRFHNIGTHL